MSMKPNDIHWAYETIELVRGSGHKPISTQFQRILRRYCPPPAKVIDLTAGSLSLWHNMVDLRGYDLTFADKRPKTRDVEKYDMLKIPWPWVDGGSYGIYDGAVVDTPYQFSPREWEDRPRVITHKVGQKYGLHEVAWSLDEFTRALVAMNQMLPRLLKRDGLLLVKIMSTHMDQTFYPNQSIIWALLSNLTQVDERIVHIQSAGGFAYKERAKKNLLRFMVFRNRHPKVHLRTLL